MSADLVLDLTHRRGDFTLSVEVSRPAMGVTGIFGPSGAGKTTLLRLIAGFDRPDRGRIVFDGEDWTGLPPSRRPVGTVFQAPRLFPHLSVRGNLDYAVKRAAAGGPGFADVVEALDLAPLLDRRTHTLSGGEAQRVALGRALMTAPRLLLLDEPLAALDAERKAAILPYLGSALKRFAIPALYVSHSIDEMVRLADRIMVLRDGRVAAFGPAAAVIEGLDPAPGEGFEAGVIVEAAVADRPNAYGLSRLDLAGQALTVPGLDGVSEGAVVRLRIRARDVAIATQRPEGLSIRNVIEVRLLERRDRGVHADLLLDAGGPHLRARITRESADALSLVEGQTVFALIKTVSLEGLV
ncbi:MULTISPECIES: molybdenum ABC transporter ATP-binding protein [Hyphobacterium]|uniref:Molybdenum ABC transporter ATP-binding protein n=1 Tax=Hyphobacterium vulgare TaxID=1736751 RepID=A0ABV6ZYA5_9PROT